MEGERNEIGVEVGENEVLIQAGKSTLFSAPLLEEVAGSTDYASQLKMVRLFSPRGGEGNKVLPEESIKPVTFDQTGNFRVAGLDEQAATALRGVVTSLRTGGAYAMRAAGAVLSFFFEPQTKNKPPECAQTQCSALLACLLTLEHAPLSRRLSSLPPDRSSAQPHVTPGHSPLSPSSHTHAHTRSGDSLARAFFHQPLLPF